MLTAEEHETRIDLYNKGMNDSEIAKILHYSPENIRYWRKKNNLPCVKTNNKKVKLTDKMLKKMFKLYSKGYTDRLLGKELGINRTTVFYWRKRKNLPPNYNRRTK